MKYVRLLSDLHQEFLKTFWEIPPLPNDKDTILILAGDIGLATKVSTYVDFLTHCSEQFGEVIYLLGNHEHYKGNFPRSKQKIKEALYFLENVNVVDEDVIDVGDTVFICATMWTSMRQGHPEVVFKAENMMNEYHCVRTGPESEPWKRKLRASDTMNAHQRQINFIFDQIQHYKRSDKKIVVVSHHGCSAKSVPWEYKTSMINDAYVEELFEPITEAEPDYWFHGHNHSKSDYMINKTRVLCNPKGYPDEKTGFDPLLLINLEEGHG